GTLKGIVVAIVVSLVAMAYQAATPHVHVMARKRGTSFFRPMSAEHPDDETYSGLLMVRPEGRVFFANAERLGAQILQQVARESPRVVALDMSRVFDLEYTALKMLVNAEQRLREGGIELWLVGLNPGVLAMVNRTPLAATLGRERMHFNLDTA